MSGEKRATVSINTSQSNAVGTQSDIASDLATVGVAAAALGTAAAIGAGVVIVKSTVAIANQAQIQWHKNAVRKCKRKVSDLHKSNAISLYAGEEIKVLISETLSKITAINVPNTTSGARAADAQAAEYLREIEIAARPAVLKYEFIASCSDLKQNLDPHKSLSLKRLEKVELELQELKNSIERTNTDSILSTESSTRSQIDLLTKECTEVLKCVEQFLILKGYIEEIKDQPWAQNLNSSSALSIADKETLSVQDIDNEYDLLKKQAVKEYIKAQADKKFEEELRYKRIEKLEGKAAAIEERYRYLKEQYYKEGQSLFSNASSLLSKMKGTLYNKEMDNTEKYLKQLEKELSQLPQAFDNMKKEEQEKSVIINNFLERFKVIYDLIANDSNLPQEFRESYQSQLKSYQSQLEDLRLRVTMLSKKSLDKVKIGIEKLDNELINMEKQLPERGIDHGVRNLIKNFKMDNLKWDENDLENFESEADEFRLSAEMDDGDSLIIDYHVDEEGKIVLHKLDDGENASCEAFKELLRWIDKNLNQAASGIQINIDMKDEQDENINLYEEESLKEEEHYKEEYEQEAPKTLYKKL